jgi:hypothetical protein
MFGISISRRTTVGATAVCLAMGGMQATAFADTQVVPPPDRVNRIGVNAPDAAPVQLSPDRADGLGSARLPTMPTPVYMVRTVSDHSYDWMAAVSGAAAAVALVLIAAAARLVRTGRVATGRL